MILLKISGINGMDIHNYLQGGIIAILSVIMVFVILLLIILLTELIESLINKSKNEPVMDSVVTNHPQVEALDLNDENKVVAALVASIDYRNQTKKNIKVISVREVK